MKKFNLDEAKQFSESIIKTDLSSFIQKCFATVNPGTKYLHNWHIDLIAETLKKCEDGKIKRLIINIPPRYLKSLSVNVAWPCWLMAKDPSRRIISASYSQGLSTKHSLDSRLVINSKWYQAAFPNTRIVTDQNEKDKFVTTQRGFRFATSVGGTITGEGGNFLIVDDPHNPAHIMSKAQRENVLNWYEQVFASRLDDKNKGVIVLIMQRLHPEDLTNHLTTKAKKVWHHLVIPAITEKNIIYNDKFIFPKNTSLHPARESKKQLKITKAELGGFNFSAQYLQKPLSEENGMVKYAWFDRYLTPPNNLTNITQSWDTGIKSSATSDYSVCTTWGESENKYYLLNVTRVKMEYPELKRKILQMRDEYSPEVILIEDKASGQSLIQELRAETKIPIIPVNPINDKVTRFARVSTMIEAGKVSIPKKVEWLEDFEAEIFSFPNVSHDDQVDSLSQYLNRARTEELFQPRMRRIF